MDNGLSNVMDLIKRQTWEKLFKRREFIHIDAVKEFYGESGSGEKFYDAEDVVQGSEEVSEDIPDMPTPASVQQKEKAPAGVDPSAPTGNIPDSVMSKL
ncbi:hypothetical protein Dimus_004178 [Dionaea muscipula]